MIKMFIFALSFGFYSKDWDKIKREFSASKIENSETVPATVGLSLS